MKTFEQYVNEAEDKRPGLLGATKALVKAIEEGGFLLGQDTVRKEALRFAVTDAHNAIKQTLAKSKRSYEKTRDTWSQRFMQQPLRKDNVAEPGQVSSEGAETNVA